SPAASRDWQYHLINYIKRYESTKPKQHPVGMSAAGDDADLFASPADWISPRGDANNPPATDGSKVIIYDTDHLCGVCSDRQWVWKNLTRGSNLVFMDPYDGAAPGRGAPLDYDPNNANDVSMRKNMGYALRYANRLNLAAMTPHNEFTGGEATVNLLAIAGEFNIEWFNPADGATLNGGVVTGGAQRSFTAPFAGDAVLYLYQQPVAPRFRLFLPVVGDGSVTTTPAGPYAAGQQVTVAASPAPGWAFSAWSGDFTGPTNPISLTMTQDKTITATFAPVVTPPATYTVTLRIVGEGAVALSATGPFTKGQTVRVTALPDPSWAFTAWSGDWSGSGASWQTTITNALALTATFETNQLFVPAASGK
ncbi:MAG: hypothetical protein DYG89_43545, partial [Caldilinea sp. CFX5]|nr:hypothetical protein [Caldilinea sp. CFX5]